MVNVRMSNLLLARCFNDRLKNKFIGEVKGAFFAWARNYTHVSNMATIIVEGEEAVQMLTTIGAPVWGTSFATRETKKLGVKCREFTPKK